MYVMSVTKDTASTYWYIVSRREPRRPTCGMLQSLQEDETLEAPLPSPQELPTLPFDQLIAALRAAADSEEGATLAAACCFQLAVLVQRMDESLVDTDAIVATIAAMGAHSAAATVQSAGCEVIAFMCLGARDAGANELAHAHLTQALQAGGLMAVAEAMNAHADSSPEVLQRGVMALSVLMGRDPSLRQQAASAGVRADWLAFASQLAGGESDGVEAAEMIDVGDEDATDGADMQVGALSNSMTDSRELDDLVEAALCAVCADQKTNEADSSLLSVDTPRQWLGNLLIQQAHPYSHATLNAVDRLLAAERAVGRASRQPTADDLPNALWLPSIGSTKLCAWRGDIRELAVGAVVNAANEGGLGCFQPSHICIDNVLHRAAGPRLREECRALMAERPGGRLMSGDPPLVTNGYQLHAAHVLHVTGPTIVPKGRQPSEAERKKLSQCYSGCLEAAASAQLRSVAFCCVSTGLFGYPHAAAAECAVSTVTSWLAAHPERAAELECVVFDVFTDSDAQAYAHATANARQRGAW